MVADLLDGIAASDGRERQAHESHIIQQLLCDRDKRLLKVLRTARASTKLVDVVSAHLEADRESRVASNGVAQSLGLSDPARSLLQHLKEQKLSTMVADARKLLKKRAKVEKEREAVERDLAVTPEEADIKKVADRLKEATQADTPSTSRPAAWIRRSSPSRPPVMNGSGSSSGNGKVRPPRNSSRKMPGD
jgi:hypothetical protein